MRIQTEIGTITASKSTMKELIFALGCAEAYHTSVGHHYQASLFREAKEQIYVELKKNVPRGT